jgi:AhpD family alkylhydroperoxidase
MSRVEGRDSLLVRASDQYLKRTYGRAMEITRVIGLSTWNMIGWGVLEFGHDRSHKVDERLKMLAETKVATTVGCQFCIDMATALGRKSGVTEEQLRDFHSYKESDAFSPLEKLAMEYAEEMSQTNVDISDELFAKLHEHLDDEQLVELTAAIAIENFRSRFNNALEIPSAGFSDGQYCPLPERHAAQAEAVAAGNGAP